MQDFGPALAAFSKEISAQDLMPLWERQARLKPGSSCVPALWQYQHMRPLLDKAAQLITKKQAERRVLVLENPSLRGSTFIANSLYCGLQIILPGEVAPSHRHSPNALRFIIEGEGAYTAVGGERTIMSPGDFIVTPNWAWHDHGNLGNEPVVWMDGLDFAIVALFGAMFREDYPHDSHPLTRQDGDALARYGSGLLPVNTDATPGQGSATPVLRYPYDRTRQALEQLSQRADADPAQGYKLRYVNPANGGHPFPTMAACMQWLPAGFNGKAMRSSENAVYSVVEGCGSVVIGEQRFDFRAHDTFVVPSWEYCRFESAQSCVLFSYSDRAAQQALGLLREERAA